MGFLASHFVFLSFFFIILGDCYDHFNFLLVSTHGRNKESQNTYWEGENQMPFVTIT